MMEILHLEPTDTTPGVIFDSEDLQIIIHGASLPKNAEEFYKPLVNWMESFSRQLPETYAPISVEVKLQHYNSASWMYISEIFKTIGRIHETGMRIIIDWYTNENDDYLREVGQELSEVSDLPFNFVEE